ncbi:MAG TPA: O-antigen ligase family protein, partial [Luteitalea sp.]|nr:O-antigen ligase family protein [Luteitalea sp.]
RAVALVSFPFVVNTIILCNSRGATLAMVGMGVAGILLTRGPQRRGLLALSVAGALAFLFLADPEFLERQATLVADERDSSSEGRLKSWAGALELMKDYPLGAGGGGYDILSPVYIPEVVAAYDGAERAVHNTFLWVGSDWGVAGLVSFCVFLFGTFVVVHRARHLAVDVRTNMEGVAVQSAIVGIAIGGFFINRTYGEIMYWVPALGVCLVNIIDADVASLPVAVDGAKTQPEAASLACTT